jgi:DNA-binding response OmpR family regulator
MSGPRLLVVDDDDCTASFLESLLHRAGYHVTVADGGQRAMDLLDQSPPFATVLLDRRMVRVGGMEVLQHMKHSERLRDIPVVIETGMDREEDVCEGLKAGALYYLTKPLDPKLVVQVVAAATDQYAARQKFWAEMEGTRQAMERIRQGIFQYQTLQQCYDLTALLAKAAPNPRKTVTGLSELMINALEHGNLGINYEEKGLLIESESWTREILRLQDLPENRAKWVTVTVSRTPTRTRFRIRDQGAGFNWRDYQVHNVERLYDSHGRGILLAKWQAFDHLEYLGNGNCVVAEIHHTDC